LGVLEKINNLKGLLKSIEEDINSLPEDLITIVNKDTKSLRNLVNTIGINIEKYFRDQKNIKEMSKNILSRMDELEIYKGLSGNQKSAITNKIISNADLILIGSEELREFMQDKLQTDSAENLIKRAYSKKDIISLGDAVTSSSDAGEMVKYDAGLNVLRDMVKTPTGRKDAITHGIKRLMGNLTTLQYYLLLYYGVR